MRVCHYWDCGLHKNFRAATYLLESHRVKRSLKQLKKCFFYTRLTLEIKKEACHTFSVQTQLAREVKIPTASKCN